MAFTINLNDQIELDLPSLVKWEPYISFRKAFAQNTDFNQHMASEQ